MTIFKRICLALLLLPVALLAVMSYLPARMAAYFTFIPLGVMPLVFVYAVCVAVLFAVHSRWKWIFAVAFLYSLWQIGGTCNIRVFRRQTEEGTFPVRIVSWNAQDFHLKADILRRASRALLEQQPDILCFQERPHTVLLAWDTIRSVFSAYPYTAKNSREDEVLNLAVFSRWRLSGLKEYYFPDSYNKFLQVDIHTGNQVIRLFNVHLQTTGMTSGLEDVNRWQQMLHHAWKRNVQADSLREAIASSPYPVIVCGDFNDVPSSYAYTQVSRNLKDCFKEAGCGWGSSYQALWHLFRIDYMFCSKEAEVADYLLLGNHWSDHKIQCGTICFPFK